MGAFPPILQLWLGAAAIGVVPVLVKLAMAAGVGPTAVAVWRCGVAGLVLLPFLRTRSFRTAFAPTASDAAGGTGRWLWELLGPGLWFALDLTFYHQALARTTAGHATLITNLQVFAVAGYGALVLGERIRWPYFGGAGLALAGLAVLVRADLGTSSTAVAGDLMALATMVFYSGYIVTIRAVRSRRSLIWVMVSSSLGAAAWCTPVAIGQGESWLPSAGGWAPLLALALGGHVLGQGLIARSAPHLPVSTVGLVLLLQPVIASAAGAWVLDEALGPAQWLGMGLVLLGIEWARRSGRDLPGQEVPRGQERLRNKRSG